MIACNVLLTYPDLNEPFDIETDPIINLAPLLNNTATLLPSSVTS
jgi:hypothetical protein